VTDGGKLGLSDVVSWEFFSLDDDDGDTFSGKGCSGVGSTWAASDDEDSSCFGLVLGHLSHGISG